MNSTNRNDSTDDLSGEFESSYLSFADPSAFEELEGRSMMSGSHLTLGAAASLVTPTAVTANATSATNVNITWTDTDRAATGFTIMRSTDGTSFSQLGRVTTATLRTYSDATALANRTYYYKVQATATGKTSELSGAASAMTKLAAPTTLVATIHGTTDVALTWRNNDNGASGYKVLRASDGVHFATLETLSGGSVASYTDQGIVSGVAYSYQIQAISEANTSLATAAVKAAITLTAPDTLAASASATSVTITWAHNDPRATNMVVLRSTDGTTYTTLATLASSITTYTDRTVTTGSVYYYKVRATNTVAPAGTSDALRTSTPLIAPTNLAANISGTRIALTWTNPNRTGIAYLVMRSTNGTDFTNLATLAPGAAAAYTDTTCAGNTQYYYKVKAVAGSIISDASTAATATTPDGVSTVTLATRYTNELVVTSLGASDTISVSQSGSTLTLLIDGQSFTRSTTDGGLFIYDRGTSCTITIDASVTVRTTISGIGLGRTTVTSGASNVSAWIDSTDTFTGSGTAHRVASFLGGTTKAVGVSLANPTDSGATRAVSASLWGTGPVVGDINQGSVGDCYFLASLAAFANTSVAMLRESAMDMGDGTFVVQFIRSNAPTFIRVSNVLPTGGFDGFRYAHPGTNSTIWGAVMEKAYCYFRTGANTYASISGGWMGAVYTAFGVANTSFSIGTNESSFFSQMSSSLMSGKVVTLGTGSTGPMVHGHAYTLISATRDEAGIARYVVRNPWGSSGTSLENSTGFATLTFAQMQAGFVSGAIAA